MNCFIMKSLKQMSLNLSNRDRLTARQCLDHPWLQDLKKSMSINVPIPDHAESWANEMVAPSNWRMSPDRRSSLPSAELSPANYASPSPPPAVKTVASEEKDSISNTLSNIDIDFDQASAGAASFDTCGDSIERTSSSDASFASPLARNSKVYSSKKTLSSENSLNETFTNNLSPCVSEMVSELLGAMPKKTEARGILRANGADNCISNSENVEPNQLPNASGRDSNKLEYTKKRMSIEIPSKKAKCVEDPSEGSAVEVSTTPETSDHVGTTSSNESFHSCHDDNRNAV